VKKNFNWQPNLILVLVIIVATIIMGRLFYLQVLQRKLFQAQALGQQVDFNKVVGSRGQVFCQNSQQSKGGQSLGEIKSLAINKDSWIISASIKEIPDKNLFAENISSIIGIEKEQIVSKLSGETNYVVLAKNISSDQLDKLKELKLAGLSWQNEPDRFYPQGKMASHILGFLGGAGAGQYGVEGYYDDILQGKSGMLEEKSGIDAIFSSVNINSLDGADVYLTIDYNIQFQAENLLKQEQIKNDIDSGQIIVIKPDTGKILALANFPEFDPNSYSKEKDLIVFQNSATQKLFEPGSILKPFTMAAALNEGKITPDTTYIDTGVVYFGVKSIHNFANEVYGKKTMTEVLENSINTGVVFAEQQIDHKTFYNYLDKFGFFKKTGVDLQGETYSQNLALKNGPDMNYATASFGQGIELTPIQIVRGFCAIANGGKLVKPYIVEKIVSSANGAPFETYTKPEVSKPIISQQTVSQLNTMLISVVDNGFNKVAKIPGYYFAGKTGTAQVPLLTQKGYYEDRTIQSFIGYGPALNPQFLIMVKLDNPKVSMSSLSAVPVFKQLAQYIINYWQIPPDYDINAE